MCVLLPSRCLFYFATWFSHFCHCQWTRMLYWIMNCLVTRSPVSVIMWPMLIVTHNCDPWRWKATRCYISSARYFFFVKCEVSTAYTRVQVIMCWNVSKTTVELRFLWSDFLKIVSLANSNLERLVVVMRRFSSAFIFARGTVYNSSGGSTTASLGTLSWKFTLWWSWSVQLPAVMRRRAVGNWRSAYLRCASNLFFATTTLLVLWHLWHLRGSTNTSPCFAFCLLMNDSWTVNPRRQVAHSVHCDMRMM